MGYPCALGITTPMLAAIAGGKGISIGLLVKASEVFYGLSIVDTVVFDKTGTLTYGRPTVTDVETFNIDRLDALAIAAAVESRSEHPLAQSVRFYAQREGARKIEAQGFRAVPGKGVSATVEESEILIGNPSFVKERGVSFNDKVSTRISTLSGEGKTVIVLARSGEAVGVIAMQDTPREGAAQVIEKLKHRGIKTIMLTGDAQGVATAIGKQLGIDEVKAELLPTDKVAAIESFQNKGRKVAMVGDGINDAPGLAQSDVGIAIGAGTDVAIESAGVILIGDRLHDVINALILGKASYRTMTGNVIIAVLFNILGMILASIGFITPALAISVMIFSIFAILLNTLRIRGIKLERPQQVKSAPLAEVEFSVPNMVCEGCAGKISSVLKELPGVKEVKPKVYQKHVYVSYEPDKIQQQKLKETLKESGFTAIEI
jgi:heavy metal translocating P-type ATPase